MFSRVPGGTTGAIKSDDLQIFVEIQQKKFELIYSLPCTLVR